MIRQIYSYLSGVVLAFAAEASSANGIDQHRLLNGMDIYYGLVPAAVVDWLAQCVGQWGKRYDA